MGVRLIYEFTCDRCEKKDRSVSYSHEFGMAPARPLLPVGWASLPDCGLLCEDHRFVVVDKWHDKPMLNLRRQIDFPSPTEGDIKA